MVFGFKKRPVKPEQAAPFIVGVGRSGTTLLRMMLDAHPDLAIPPETNFMEDVLQLRGRGSSLRRRFVETLTGFGTWTDFHIPTGDLEARLARLEHFSLGEGLRTFYRLYADRFGKSRWGDKSPRHCTLIEKIHQALPEARFIHLIRDGRDVALSVQDLWFGPGRDIRDQAGRWTSKIRETRRQGKACPHYLELRYEDLVADPEPALRLICSFIDLPWDGVMLAYHETAQQRLDELGDRFLRNRNEMIPRADRIDIHRNTTRPPDPNLIGKWRTHMEAGDRACFEEIAGGLLEELGYETARRPGGTGHG